MSEPFKFKQFTIHQDRCAMKVGTDGVLLGAWTSLENNPHSILDIGSGTGLIALQLAQRSAAQTIDAIELDENAYEQCVGNFEASDWSDRLFCYHASLQEYVEELDDTYDLIVSNPPFYTEDFGCVSGTRAMARQEHSLPFEELISSVAKLLSDQGEFALIIPHKEEENIIRLAGQFDLLPKKIMRVKGNPTSATKRSLLQFSFTAQELKMEELVIEIGRHEYTPEYQELTQVFYLKM
ncbi:methyltransferase [Croceitalea sp. MTPC5]|uniref:tRNA1(Val) (adenine(37)-N6)-methyltransferase n=1 Tax=Croceitalea sp. MTPC5 TaxID=3056565 RepID=UPI002B3C593D|nr:methyltransferase [Croceitalea sp. MTPC5]